MSIKLCCGTLSVSQLTIPAVPTSELERLGHRDDSSVEDTASLTDQIDNDDEPSGTSTVCEDDCTTASGEIYKNNFLNPPQLDKSGSASNLNVTSSTTSVSEPSTPVTKPVVRKKVKSVSSKKKDKMKDLNKKKSLSKFFKLKKRVPSSSSVRSAMGDDVSPLSSNANLPESSNITNCVGTSFRRNPDSLFDTVAASSIIDSMPSSGRASPQASVSHLAMGACAGPSRILDQDFNIRLSDIDLSRVSEIDMLAKVPPPPPGACRTQRTGDFDEDRVRMLQRIKEMELGIEINRGHSAYPHFQYPSARNSLSTSSSSNSDSLWSLTCNFQNQCTTSVPRFPPPPPGESPPHQPPPIQIQGGLTTFGHGRAQDSNNPRQSQSLLSLPPPGPCIPRTEYTQVDYIHCLVPDLFRIANCSFYWGVMDRYEAERLLDNRPEGTFLLRDSAQDDFLFSVSFRRYGRSLHARIDQWNHKFSFDTHDPGVFAAPTVTGLIEHYKDPNCCMFFEPMLTIPLCRNFPFSLQHLCRSQICGKTTYDGLSYLPLPKSLCQYLKYYHYKQKVRVRRMHVFS